MSRGCSDLRFDISSKIRDAAFADDAVPKIFLFVVLNVTIFIHLPESLPELHHLFTMK